MLSKRLTIRALALPLLAGALCGPLQAAELGEVKVNSHIGQQLSADIELVDLTAADLAELQARLANPDVFKGANLSMPPVLGGMHISVAKRDNRRFLHLTTLQPVTADALHLFLELSSGGRQIIRAASLWLTPEPPAPRVARASTAAAAMPTPPAAPVAAVAPQAPAAAPQAAPENLEAAMNEAAQRAFAHRRQVAQAQVQAATPAAAPAMSAAAPVKRSPAPAQPMVRKEQPKPAAAPTQAPATSEASAVKPVVAAPAAACAPAQQVEAQMQQCQAMTSKLADIEGKVKRLQTALGAPGALPPPPATKADGAPAMPHAAPAKPGAAPIKPGVAADLAGKSKSNLIIIAGAVIGALAILGGLVYFLRKRRGKGPLQIWQSFRKKGNAEAKEPVLEEPVAAEG